MTSDAPQPPLDPTPETPPAPQPEPLVILTDAASTPPVESKRPKNRVLIIGAIIGVVLTCLCVVGVMVAVSSGTGQFAVEQYSITQVLDKFMYAMKVKNPERAYGFFSPRAQRQLPLSKVQEMLEGNNYVLYDGYKSLELKNTKVSAAFNTDQNKPQGTVATVSGTVTYADGTEGALSAILEKVDDEWRIHYVTVNVPPSKFK